MNLSCFTFVSADCICTEQENFDPTISCNNLKKCPNQYFQSFWHFFTLMLMFDVSQQQLFIGFPVKTFSSQSIFVLLFLLHNRFQIFSPGLEFANCNNVSFGGICKHSIFKILRNKKLQLHELWQRQLHRTLGMKLIIYYLKRKEDRPHGGGGGSWWMQVQRSCAPEKVPIWWWTSLYRERSYCVSLTETKL